jgi:Na+-translocating ferredoxin:NAD+ oxidoreductase RnfE subunit
MQTIDLQAYSQPLFQMYVLSIPAITTLIVANIIVVRKEGHAMKRGEH